MWDVGCGCDVAVKDINPFYNTTKGGGAPSVKPTGAGLRCVLGERVVIKIMLTLSTSPRPNEVVMKELCIGSVDRRAH
jgi:hypothetical protein